MPYGSKRGSGEVEGKSERDKEEFADVPKLQFVRYFRDVPTLEKPNETKEVCLKGREIQCPTWTKPSKN